MRGEGTAADRLLQGLASVLAGAVAGLLLTYVIKLPAHRNLERYAILRAPARQVSPTPAQPCVTIMLGN
jgi:hypothetical protein